ncbi:MAG: helix-turn-helix domain-containing protein [Roseburia sp.]|nr:helix-turn-helix domain-containing protein [Roseburia sp.]
MESLGKTITEYRKKSELTQKDLGEMLNVSPQAVSKWENGQAEPDTSTLKKLSEIFKISTDELLGNLPPETEAAPAVEILPAPETQYQAETVTEAEAITETAPEPEQYEINAAQASVKTSAPVKYINYEKRRTDIKSVICGAVAGVAVFCALFFSLVYAGEVPAWFAGPFAAVFGVAYFSFVMQMFWDGVVKEMFFFFLKSFQMPGVIFTLDLDGLLFLLLVKVGGAILSVILSVIFFLIGMIITPIGSIMILPFAAVARVLKG